MSNVIQIETDDVSTTESCPECNGSLSPPDEGERYCTECGLVTSEGTIDRGVYWWPDQARTKKHHRSVMPHTRDDKGLGSLWRANPGSAASKRQRSLEDRNGDRHLRHYLGDIKRVVSLLDLSSQIEYRAAYLLRWARNEREWCGFAQEDLVAAVVLVAARENEIPLTLDAVAEAAEADHLRPILSHLREMELTIPIIHPAWWVAPIASKLDIAPDKRTRAEEIVRDAIENGYCQGAKPQAVSAAAIYLVTELTQGEITDVADCSEVSLRQQRDALLEVVTANA